MTLTTTRMHAAVTLEVSRRAFDEIAELIRRAGYDWAFMDDSLLDMTGIALAIHERAADSAGWQLRFKRQLGLAAPADGRCTEKTWRHTRVDEYDSVHEYTTHYRCTKPWGHRDDNHPMDRVEDPS